MRRIILMLLATILISACARQGQYSASGTFDASRALLDECDDKGGTHVNLIYDNHQIRTVAVARLKAGEIFAIRLKPKNDQKNDRPNIDYETETVTISGKGAASAWLSASGSYNNTNPPHHELVICVPLKQPDGQYYYQIEINEAGKLDPRADVY